MTELQPSPPGYRVQDEAPGPPSCPPGSYKYASHGHGSETANFKSTSSYPQEGYGLKQSPSRTVPPNEYYRRRNDGRRSTENEHEATNAAKKATVAGYNETYKKNTAGYKNDSGYVTFDRLLLVVSSLLSVILIAFCFSRHLSFTRCYIWIDATRVLKSSIFLIFYI